MLNGSNSIRVAVLAALVLAVAFSSTVGSQISVGVAAAGAAGQTRSQSVERQALNSAWQAQVSDQPSRLQRIQQTTPQQQTAPQAAGGSSTLAPGPAPTPAPSPAATTTSGQTGGSIQSIIQSAFAPLGSAAVDWGLCVAEDESGDNPDAVSPSGAEGLFQFLPSTFDKTPEGQAGESIWDPSANAQAAAWMYSQGQQGQWSTNSEC